MTHLDFDPLIPVGLWLPLAAAAAALLAGYSIAARRRLSRPRWWAITALMAASMAVPLAILSNPTWISRVPPPEGKPRLTVLVDRSASMALTDGGGERRRFDRACQAARELAAEPSQEFDVRVRTFADTSEEMSAGGLAELDPDGESTDLAAAIASALDDDVPQGQALMLLTDAAHNGEGGIDALRRAAEKARSFAAPIYAQVIGGRVQINDLAVSVDSPEELAFVEQQTPVTVRIRRRGTLPSKVALQLLLDGKELEHRNVTLDAEGRCEVTLLVAQAEAGLYRYEVRAGTLPGETISVNNSAGLLVRVVDSPVRVLLLEGKPYWDGKFLIRTLASDRLIDLQAVVRLTEDRFMERRAAATGPDEDGGAKNSSQNRSGDLRSAVSAGSETRERRQAGSESGAERRSRIGSNSAPRDSGGGPADQWQIRTTARQLLADRESLDRVQIVVLGRDAEAFLSAEALGNLERWLSEKGGSLVCFRGAPSSEVGQRLGRLMPVRWTPAEESRFRTAWTEEGQSLHWIGSAEHDELLAKLPSLAATSRAGQVSPLAVVLARRQESSDAKPLPVVSYQRVGTGRVVVVEGAGMWRWAFLPPQYRELDDAYGKLWRSLLRWLVANVGLLPSQHVAVRAPKLSFRQSESVTAEVYLRPELGLSTAPNVELRGDALPKSVTVAALPSGDDPGQFRVVFGQLPVGRYWAKVVQPAVNESSAETGFDVRGDLRERLEADAREDLLQMVVGVAGGSVLDEVDSRSVGRLFGRHLDASRPDRIVRTTAWDRWWVLAAAALLFAATWATRRRTGLT